MVFALAEGTKRAALGEAAHYRLTRPIEKRPGLVDFAERWLYDRWPAPAPYSYPMIGLFYAASDAAALALADRLPVAARLALGRPSLGLAEMAAAEGEDAVLFLGAGPILEETRADLYRYLTTLAGRLFVIVVESPARFLQMEAILTERRRGDAARRRAGREAPGGRGG